MEKKQEKKSATTQKLHLQLPHGSSHMSVCQRRGSQAGSGLTCELGPPMLLSCTDSPSPYFSVIQMGQAPYCSQPVSRRIMARDLKLIVADPQGGSRPDWGLHSSTVFIYLFSLWLVSG